MEDIQVLLTFVFGPAFVLLLDWLLLGEKQK